MTVDPYAPTGLPDGADDLADIDELHRFLAEFLVGDLILLPAGTRVEGKYEILDGPIGPRSGQGVVFKARDVLTKQPIALKVLRGNHDELEREAAATAQLECEHIVSLKTWGTHEDRPFLVLEWLEGFVTLTELAASRTLSPTETLHVLTQIAKALVAAHAAGIVHRDIKPDNILVDAELTVKVIDFGIATALGSDREWQSARAGTAPYMAPEQLAGEPQHTGVDIWSFCVLACELYMGNRPFLSLDSILHDAPLLDGVPSAIMPTIQRGLDKDANARPTATQLLTALQRIGSIRRLRRSLLLAAVLAIAASVGVVVLRDRWLADAAPAIGAQLDNAAARVMNLAREPDREREALLEGLAVVDRAKEHGLIVPALAVEALSLATATVRRTTELRGVTWAEFDPADGERILTIDATGVALRDLESGSVAPLPASSGHTRAWFTQTREILGVAPHTATIWRNGDLVHVVHVDDEVLATADYLAVRESRGIVFDDDEPPRPIIEELIVTTSPRWITVRDTSGRQRARLAVSAACDSDPVLDARFSSVNEVFIACNRRHGFWAFRSDTPDALRTVVSAINREPPALLLHGRTVVASDEGALVTYDGITREKEEVGSGWNVALAHNGSSLAVMSETKTISVLLHGDRELWHVQVKQPIDHLAIARDASAVLTVGAGTVHVIRHSPTLAMRSFPSGGSVKQVVFSPDSKRLGVVYSDWTARVWALDATARTPLADFGGQGMSFPVWQLAMSRDGRFAITTSGSRSVPIRSIDESRWSAVLDETESVYSAELSADGTRAITRTGSTGSTPPITRLWDTATQRSVGTLDATGGFETCFDPTGVRVEKCRGSNPPFRIDNDRVMLRLPTGRTVSLEAGAGAVTDAGISPDGTLVVTAHHDGNVRLWRSATGDRIAVLQGHDVAVTKATFSPDGRALVSGDEHGHAYLFPGSEQAIIEASRAALRHPPRID